MTPCGRIKPEILRQMANLNFALLRTMTDFRILTNHVENCSACRHYVEYLINLKQNPYYNLNFARLLIKQGYTIKEIWRNYLQDYFREPDDKQLKEWILIITQLELDEQFAKAKTYYTYTLPRRLAVEITGNEEKALALKSQQDVNYYYEIFGIRPN